MCLLSSIQDIDWLRFNGKNSFSNPPCQLNNLQLIMTTHVGIVAPLHMRVSIVILEICLAVYIKAEEVRIL